MRRIFSLLIMALAFPVFPVFAAGDFRVYRDLTATNIATALNAGTLTTSYTQVGTITFSSGGATAGSIKFLEGTGGGTNTATLIGPASTADVVITLPAATGTVPLLETGNTFTVAPIVDTGDNGAATPTTWASHIRGIKLSNDTASVCSGATVQDPPAIRFEGHAWDTDTPSGPGCPSGQDDKWQWSIYPDQASGTATSSTLQFVSMKSPAGVDATPTQAMYLSNGGSLYTASSMNATQFSGNTTSPTTTGIFNWGSTVTSTAQQYAMSLTPTFNQATGTASNELIHVAPVITAISGGSVGTSNYFANFLINTTPWYQFAFGSTATTGSFNASSGTQTGVLFAPVIAQSGTANYYGLDVSPTITSVGSGASAVIRAKRDGIAATAKTGLLVTNTTAATSGTPVQYSPDIKLQGTAHDTDNDVSDTHTWTIRNVPANAATTTSQLKFYSDTDGTPVERLSLTNTGILYNTGAVYAGSTKMGMRPANSFGTGTPVAGDWLYMNDTTTYPMGFFNNSIADSASAIAGIMDTTNMLVTAGAKSFQIKTGGTQVAAIGGNFRPPDAVLQTATFTGIAITPEISQNYRAISDITKGNPTTIYVTSAHGLADGDTVRFFGQVGTGATALTNSGTALAITKLSTGWTGVGGVGGVSSWTVAGSTWATNQWNYSTLTTSDAATYPITGNTGTVLTVTGTPVTGTGAWTISAPGNTTHFFVSPSTTGLTLTTVGGYCVVTSTAGAKSTGSYQALKIAPTINNAPGTANRLITAGTVDTAATYTEKFAVGQTGIVMSAGNLARSATQTVSDTTTLAADNTLTQTVVAAGVYHYKVVYFATTVATSGIKCDMAGGTATFTSWEGSTEITNMSTYALAGGGETTASNTAVGVTALGVATKVVMEGVFTVNAAGTVIPEFAQNAETGAAESVIAKVGSFMTLERLP